jgi:hypothetical protein
MMIDMSRPVFGCYSASPRAGCHFKRNRFEASDGPGTYESTAKALAEYRLADVQPGSGSMRQVAAVPDVRNLPVHFWLNDTNRFETFSREAVDERFGQ